MEKVRFWILTISFILVSGEVFAKGSTNHCLEALGYSRKLPVFEQSTPYTCGPTVLLSLLRKRGLLTTPLTDIQLGKMIGSNSEVGTSPEAMVGVLESFGLKAHLVFSNNPTEFFQQLHPNKDYILLVREGDDAHWVALSSFAGSTAKIMDPWKNRGKLKKVSKQHLIDIWSPVPFDAQTTHYNLSIEVL